MAYGKNKERKNWLMRAMPLSVGDLLAPLTDNRKKALKASKGKKAKDAVVGVLTTTKHASLASLCENVLDLMRRMAQNTFCAEPLGLVAANASESSKALDAALVGLQKAEEGLNACWSEQARMRVKPAIEESHKRYLSRLAGRLRFCEEKTPKAPALDKKLSKKKESALLAESVIFGPPRPPTLYFHVPFEIQSLVTPAELAGLKAIAEAGDAINLFRRVILGGDVSGLTANQLVILRHIHGKAQAQHRCPDFGAKDRYTLQLHLDYRMLPTVKRKALPDRPSEAMMLRTGETWLMEDEKNTCYRRFVSISGVEAGGPRIAIPVVLSRAIAKRMAGTRSDWASLIVELTTEKDHAIHAQSKQGNGRSLTVGVRLVCGKPPAEPVIDLSAVTVTLGRDFGYANTVSLSVVRSAAPVDLTEEATGLIRAQSKEDAKTFFESHACPSDVETLHQVHYSGEGFLKRINQHCDRIDKLKSRIDLGYQSLDTLRAHALVALDLHGQDLLILPEHKKSTRPGAAALARAFFQLLGQLGDLKKTRRSLYKKIADCKKNWFGFLSSIEVKLAKQYGAVIVREDLTVEAIEKESHQYKGRLFNKMLNHGAKGQYQRMGSAKFQWNGISETLIGSWYTSRACTVHSSILAPKFRKGEKLNLHCCGRREHADLHASQTIAQYHFLRPLEKSALETPEKVFGACEKHTSGSSDPGSPVL